MIKLIKKILSMIFPSAEPVAETPKRKRRSPTHRDTTKLTQWHYDIIVHRHAAWLYHNKTHSHAERRSAQDLVNEINSLMGTQKSHRALARIWNGELQREDLPEAHDVAMSEDTTQQVA
ncbi:hypothetical protein [Marinobacterium litorale]|uniref:hypothetical protein n=1 Tax=Marinobacterium litorale TaxID=404770 RepID=UPI000404BF9E|nr:hypothetical protein [Marinobacterium litorale]